MKSLRTYLRLFAHVQMLPILESGEETLVGGQAVMEGVMMCAPHSYCVAVRKASGEIVTETLPMQRLSDKHKWMKLPLLRGVATIAHSLSLGMRALKFSANAALDDGSNEVSDGKPTEIPAWAYDDPGSDFRRVLHLHVQTGPAEAGRTA